MISVIVPVYNTKKYLQGCVNSILSQTYNDFEVILVDDGSNDGSEIICDDYALREKRVRVLHQINSGVTEARRVGVEMANGEYVCFVDSDDMISAYCLENLMKHMTESIDLVISGGDKHTIIDVNEYLAELLTFNYWSPFSKLYRKSLFSSFVFSTDRDIKVGEDFCMQLKLLNNISKDIAIITDCLYDYNTCNPNSAMHKYVRSKEYEERILQEVDSVIKLLPRRIKKDYPYFNYRCIMLGGMIGYGYDINYDSPWIRELKRDANRLILSLRQKFIIAAITNRFNRRLLILEKRIKSIIRIITSVRRN